MLTTTPGIFLKYIQLQGITQVDHAGEYDAHICIIYMSLISSSECMAVSTRNIVVFLNSISQPTV